MTLTERVLRHLEETRGEWELLTMGPLKRIIRINGEECPLESLFGLTRGSITDAVAKRDHRLTGPKARTIIATADFAHEGPYFDPALRARMLEAAGMEEEES